MSINNKLVTFATQKLVLARSSNEKAKIDASLAHLEKVLNNNLPGEIKEFVRFGSYTRNTILPRKYDERSDVDLMVVFNSSNRRLLTAESYRSKIARILDRAYPNSLSKKDYPSVKLELHHIKFDVVPAYSEYILWSSVQQYYIPNKSNGWQPTEPNDINSKLSKHNQGLGGNTLRNVIRLCKHWNASFGYPLESYIMEKQIVNLGYWGNEDTYKYFLETMRSIARYIPNAQLALSEISKCQGGWYRYPDPAQEYEWLKKLLPGLK